MRTVRFEYFHDPLCGWCYASAPALQALSEAYPEQLTLLSSGLFAGRGARALTPDWAQYAWKNDQYISSVTGQVFSTEYKDHVLLGDDIAFDSTMMNRALTALAAIDTTVAAQALHELQIARYVHGQNTADAAIVAQIINDTFANQTYGIDAARLTDDIALIADTELAIGYAQARMRTLGIQGVPQLVVTVDDQMHVIASADLYAGKAHLLSTITQLLGTNAPTAPTSLNGEK